NQLRRDISEQERLIRSMVPLLSDPDLEAMTKKAVSRQIAEAQTKLEQLQGALASVGISACEDSGTRLREAELLFREAEECFSRVSCPAEFHRLVEDWVGPMVVGVDGS